MVEPDFRWCHCYAMPRRVLRTMRGTPWREGSEREGMTPACTTVMMNRRRKMRIGDSAMLMNTRVTMTEMMRGMMTRMKEEPCTGCRYHMTVMGNIEERPMRKRGRTAGTTGMMDMMMMRWRRGSFLAGMMMMTAMSRHLNEEGMTKQMTGRVCCTHHMMMMKKKSRAPMRRRVWGKVPG